MFCGLQCYCHTRYYLLLSFKGDLHMLRLQQPNKRIKVMACGHSTRKTLRVLLTPYARRWA